MVLGGMPPYTRTGVDCKGCSAVATLANTKNINFEYNCETAVDALTFIHVLKLFLHRRENLKQETIQKLVTVPILLIGIGSMAMGLLWIFLPEPWLLDQAANELLLQRSYAELLTLAGNEYLADYLKGLYGFFGLWIFALGLMVAAFVVATKMESRRSRGIVHLALTLILVMAYTLQFKYIPTSPFLWVSHSFMASLGVSFLAARRLSVSSES